MKLQLSVLAALLLIVAAAAQQATQAPSSDRQSKQGKQSNGKQEKPPPQEPAPLFGGQIGTRSSKTTKESATLGFNGIDPSGKVEKKMLAASPRPRDIEKVRHMDAAKPTQAEVTAFLKEGGLKTK